MFPRSASSRGDASHDARRERRLALVKRWTQEAVRRTGVRAEREAARDAVAGRIRAMALRRHGGSDG